MYVIVGLGNPDKKYEHTRHNIGFDVIDALADKYNISVTDKKHKALCGSGVIEGMKVLLVKPQTYMNLSGESVAEVMNFYKLDPDEEMIVIFDDISLEPGRIRIRKKGSAGGHNGIKSIIAMTGTQGFSRIKVGVGEKPQGWDLADHVLGRFSSEDRAKVEPGRIRIRKKGSAGGHNGIKSIIAMTGTQGFSRIKVGVGEKPQGWDLADHVLGRFSSEDRAKVEEAIGHAMDAAVLMMQGETDKAMNIYN